MTESNVNKHSSRRLLPVIRCEYGHEILLLHDLKIVGEAIVRHALEHKQKYDLSQEETDALEENLIVQALKLASE